jgi:hypothetical protein
VNPRRIAADSSITGTRIAMRVCGVRSSRTSAAENLPMTKLWKIAATLFAAYYVGAKTPRSSLLAER